MNDHLKFTHEANSVRGSIINEFTQLEKVIESIISDYFIDNSDNIKKVNFQLIVLDRMSFESKRTTVRSISDKIEEKKGFIKTKNKSYPNSKLFDEIRLLNDQRNYFAHYMMALPFSENNSIISLAETRDNVSIMYYTREEIDNLLNRIGEACNSIYYLFENHRSSGLF